MEMYNVEVEVAARGITDETVDAWMDGLSEFHPAISSSPRGWADVIVSLPAESWRQAVASAGAVVERVTDRPAVRVDVMTCVEFDARNGFVPLPVLIGATEAAELLGVSRQRVLQMIDGGKLPATLVGKSYVLPRVAVERLLSAGDDSL